MTLVADAARKAGLPEDQVIITSTHEDAAQVVRQLIVETRFRDASVSGEGAIHRAPTIYIKGSEETRMERVTERLMAQPEQAHDALVRQTPGWKQIVVTRPTRPTWVEIDLSAIANNTRQIAALVGPQVRILASLKADAYGHGALKVARTVLHNDASMLGVATVSEATPLREAGIWLRSTLADARSRTPRIDHHPLLARGRPGCFARSPRAPKIDCCACQS